MLDWVGYLFPRFRKAPEGEPRVIVRNGESLEGILRRDRMNRDEVESEMRLAGIGRMDDVARAILETNGKIILICRDSSRHARQPEDEVAR